MVLGQPVAGLSTARALRKLRIPDDGIRRALRADVGLSEAQIARVFAVLEGRLDVVAASMDPAPEGRLGLPVCPGCPGGTACRCLV